MRFALRTPDGVIDIAMPLPGRHNVMNALAASAAALAAGAQLSDIKEGLEAMAPVAGRLHMRLGLRGAHVLDDTYNANPRFITSRTGCIGRMSRGKMAGAGRHG